MQRPAPAGPLPRATDWQNVADWYDQSVGGEGSDYHRNVVLPGVLRLLAVGPTDRVLDVACGQGVLCRLLHARGATVVGVDAASKLIALAKERSATAPAPGGGAPGIVYHVGDARDLERHAALAAESFSAAACVLAIQNINPIQPVFAGVAKLLVPGGRFVVLMMHPAFRGPRYTAWQWDEQARVQYRRVDRYLLPRKEPIYTHPGKDPTRYTWTFHRPVQSYVKALRQAGLLVDALEEWPSHRQSDSGPRAAAENTARREIPMFLALRAVKMGYPPGSSVRSPESKDPPA